jgi:hypothetical protein
MGNISRGQLKVEVPNCRCFFSAAEVDVGSLITVIKQLVLFSSHSMSKTVLKEATHVFAYFCGNETSYLSRCIAVLIVVKYH